MLELHVQDNDVSTGAIPITWCIDRETLALLKQHPNPMLVISVIPFNANNEDGNSSLGSEQRFVVPVRDASTYISFRRPGVNRIFAFVDTDPERRTTRDAKRYWLGSNRLVVNYDGDDYNDRYVVSEVKAPFISIDVPKESFAPEPSAAEEAWVTWLFDKGRDQCGFRRRRIFAYTVQVVIMLANLIARFVGIFFAAFIGSRGTSLKYLFHPLTYTLGETIDEIFKGGIIFIRPEPESKVDPETIPAMIVYTIRRLWALPLMPPIVMFLCLIDATHAWYRLGAVIGLAFLMICGVIGGDAMAGSDGWFNRFTAWLDRLLAEAWQQDDGTDLICDGNGEPKKLAPKRKTVKLRYLAVKAKVCRPFAG